MFNHTPKQRDMELCESRFLIAPCGRRSGKTAIAKRKIVYAAAGPQTHSDARYFVGAPTRQQAKDIYWNDIKAMIPRELLLGTPKESELEIRLYNNSVIRVVGLDVPERIEGVPWNGGILDEFGNMHAHVWQSHIRPALSDRLGWCWFIGVPEGRNHYFDLYQNAIGAQDWAIFHWTTAEVLPVYLGEKEAELELAQARRDLDELTFQQEYEGQFIDFAGRAYYRFKRETHCKPIPYDTNKQIAVCLDFNISPGVALFCQEFEGFTGIVGEVHIERNSNTPKVCGKIREFLKNHRGVIYVTGDPAGNAQGTAKTRGSDWEIVEDELKVFGDRVVIRVNSAPRERARVNIVNSRLMSADGTIRLFVDPKCIYTIRDFEGVRAKDSGELDKMKTPNLTHLTDALGYYLYNLYEEDSGSGFEVLS